MPEYKAVNDAFSLSNCPQVRDGAVALPRRHHIHVILERRYLRLQDIVPLDIHLGDRVPVSVAEIPGEELLHR